MKNLVAGICLMFAILFNGNGVVFSQQDYNQTIRGTVIDLQSQSPIPGVKISVETTDPPLLGVSDIDGKFKIDNVPLGRHTIVFSMIGYDAVVISNAELKTAKELILQIQMEESITTVKEFEVKARQEKGDLNNDMTTVSSRSFSVDESKRFAGSLNDVARMAQNFAGVQGNNDSRNDIVIRGNSPIGVLYRLEGVDIPNPNHFAIAGTTGGPVSLLNNNVLANSDFMTSAFPAEYGNALSGVFDLKMRSGNNEKHEFLAQIGFNGLEFMAEGPLHKKSGASYLFSYRYSTLELFELMGINFGTAALPNYQDLSFKLNFPNKKGNVYLFGVGGLSNVELLDSEADSTDLFAIGGTDTRFRSNMGVIGAGQTLTLGKGTYLKWTLSTSAHQTIILQDSVSPVPSVSPIAYYRDHSVRGRQTLAFYVNRKWNVKNVFRVGAFINRLAFNLNDSVYRASINSFVSLSDFKGGVFQLQPYAQWQYKPSQKLTMNIGLHYHYFQRSESHSVEPRAGISWKPDQKNRFSIGYGLHSQSAPIDFYFEKVRLNDNSFSIPNQSLNFTRAHHMVFAYDRQFNENLRLKAETYYQYLYGVPVDVNNNSYSLLNEGADFGISAPDTLVNEGTGHNAGIELTFEHFLNKGFYFLITGSIYQSKYKGSDGIERNTAFNGNYAGNLLVGKELEINKNKETRKRKVFITTDIKITLNGGRRYTPILLDESITAGFTVRDRENAFSERYPSYFRSDLKLGLKIYGKKVTQEWAIDLQNLTNKKNVFNQDFDAPTGTIFTTYQIGLLPIALYRLYF